ncbi:alpha/beta hydrolase [Pseudoalteromonas byunsanensis]|uniref:alpha/beta hydrolase n=1 Tax=Pseudoalteromonas byunsanensis TaxID=327939 RepID=UPI0015864B95
MFLSIMVLYFTIGIVTLRFYLDELVFKPAVQEQTQETSLLSIPFATNEILIRSYAKNNIQACIVFFPGRSGGIRRYENELFNRFTSQGASVHAISYPGYEGASGKSRLSNVAAHIEQALKQLEIQTSCRIDKSIFVGRSLGAALAIETAKNLPPKALVLDSVGVSLESVVRYQLGKRTLTKPLLLLPIDKILPFKHDLKSSLFALNDVEFYIFQGEEDLMINYHELVNKMDGLPLEKIMPVSGANHSNTHILAGDSYVDRILSLLQK